MEPTASSPATPTRRRLVYSLVTTPDSFQAAMDLNSSRTPSKEMILSTRGFLKSSLQVLPPLPASSSEDFDMVQDLPAQSVSPETGPTHLTPLRRNSFRVSRPLASSPKFSDLDQDISSQPANTTSITPLRRRHSVESNSSPASISPSRKSPPRKKRTNGNLANLRISPPGFKYNGTVYDELFESIYDHWDDNFNDVLCARYDCTDGLFSSLRVLGFDDEVISGVSNMLNLFFEEFGKNVIEFVLCMETIESLATILLDVEVEKFSDELIEGNEDAPSSPTPLHTVPPLSSQSNIPQPPSLFTITPNNEPSSDQASASGHAATQSKTPGSPPWIIVDRKRKGKGNANPQPVPPPPSPPKEFAKELAASTSHMQKYPEWLIDLHKLAAAKGITVIFTNEDPAYDNFEHILPEIEYWPSTVTQPAVDLYHACEISTRSIRNLTATLASFIEEGVRRNHHGRNRAGYLSSRPAAYFTNSFLYARFWPHLKNGFENYAQIRTIPPPSMLLCCLRLHSDDFFGRTGELLTARIKQSDRDSLVEIQSATNASLTVDQFVQMNLNRKHPPPSRVPIPGMGEWTKDADFIVSGLTKREMENIERTDIGDSSQYVQNLCRINFAAACTEKAVQYMKQHMSRIIVFGFGDGKLGRDCLAADFGTAGIARDYRSYHWPGRH